VSAPALLSVEGLTVAFDRYAGAMGRARTAVLHDVWAEVAAGEVLAVLGASGAGKSLLAHAVLGMLPANARVAGRIRFDGQALEGRLLARCRGREIALVPQAVTWLDPMARVGDQVRRAAQCGGVGRADAGRAAEALSRYGLPPADARAFPHQLSGGMARRVLTAMATVGAARLVLADEPTTGLDPETAAVALGHLRALADDGRGVLVITHDIDAVLDIADRVAVLHAGMTVETTDAAAFTGDGGDLRHPYTRALWAALPRNGFVPLPRDAGPEPAQGCAFAPQCGSASEVCRTVTPDLRPPDRARTSHHRVRCHHADRA
jgi:peptide/nickel transport system ATP-binding protein